MMEGYLLDTNICIYLLKKKYGIAKKLDTIHGMRICVSEITLAELYYGASKSNKDGMKEEVDFIADTFEIVPIRSSLELYGRNKATLEKKGERIDDFDLLIGSSAIQNNLIAVTENVKHLGRIPNIIIENWINRE